MLILFGSICLAFKSAHRAELDDVQAWIEDYCTKQDGGFASVETLHRSYKNWCESNGHTPKQARRFGQTLKRKGFVDTKQYVNSRQVRGYSGLSVNIST